MTIPHHAPDAAPLILLIEDHQGVTNYLIQLLGFQYRLQTAAHGKEAILMLETVCPDLIISDVMMPEMDGYAFCAHIKQNEATNHIPVILLTAKASDRDRKEGLGVGADAYLIKPFDPEELLIRMEQLLRQRENLKKKYWQAARVRRLEEMDLPLESASFMERLDECIFQHIADPKFKVDQLAAAMFMSRSTLLKEVKNATGKSPSAYLKQTRLDLADQLLRETDLTIAAIAQQTAFSSDSYLTKQYRECFGLNPSEQRKTMLAD